MDKKLKRKIYSCTSVIIIENSFKSGETREIQKKNNKSLQIDYNYVSCIIHVDEVCDDPSTFSVDVVCECTSIVYADVSLALAFDSIFYSFDSSSFLAFS